MKLPFRSIGYLLASLVMTLLQSSCEDVIDLGLNNAAPKLVIEGWVDDVAGPSVTISKTTAFTADLSENPQQVLSGATVTLTDNYGHTAVLTDKVTPGQYRVEEAANFLGKPGRTYTLKVEADSQTYQAVSTMPIPVPIDSVGTVTSDIFDGERKGAGLLFTDPPGVKNQYRYEVWVNDVFLKTIFIYNDKYNDGKTITRELIDFEEDDDDKKIVIGDRVRVNIYNIDEAVYKYWFSLDENNPGSAAPGNPVSNISNGALGYFSAQTSQQVELIIQ
ncbi:protein of unknown function [bacterium A37T11]|nr:protein of unknown function [bacterium A37T11]